MKIFYITSLLFFLFSCTNKKSNSVKNKNKEIKYEIVVPEFQRILDAASINGSILISDLENGKYYSNDFKS